MTYIDRNIEKAPSNGSNDMSIRADVKVERHRIALPLGEQGKGTVCAIRFVRKLPWDHRRNNYSSEGNCSAVLMYPMNYLLSVY